MNRSRLAVAALAACATVLTAAGWAGSRVEGQTATSAPASKPTTTTSAPSARAVHAFVSGKVQGVGFRAFVVTSAKPLKVTGWVKNLPDGRVEAVIEGPSDQVDALLEKMKKGPASAKVEDLKFTEERPTGEFKDFTQR